MLNERRTGYWNLCVTLYQQATRACLLLHLVSMQMDITVYCSRLGEKQKKMNVAVPSVL